MENPSAPVHSVLCLSPRGALDFEAEEALLATLEERLARGQTFSLLLDASDVSYVRPAAIINVASFMRAHREAAKACLSRSFIVATNQVVSALLSTLLAMQPPETEVIIFDNLDDAIAAAYPIPTLERTRVSCQ